jgi:hypothetical protein
VTFDREGWSPRTFKVRDRCNPMITGIEAHGWVHGHFGIYDHEWYNRESCEMLGATPLVHLATGFRLANFLRTDEAAEAAEAWEPLADWDVALSVSSTGAARARLDEIIGDRWNDYFKHDVPFYDGDSVHVHVRQIADRTRRP